MVLLQHKLSVKLSQRQILTPGLVQMVSVLALNKLELKDMINAEMVENPVLEELEESVPLLDEIGGKEEDRERASTVSTEENPVTAAEKKDPFEEIDFGSFFQDYLDPGYRTRGEMEQIERPSFENFLSKPTNLTDHLAWQVGALSLRPEVREAAEQIIGNLNEDGYLIASDEEMLGVAPPAPPEADAVASRNIVSEALALGLTPADDASGENAVEEENPEAGISAGEFDGARVTESNPIQPFTLNSAAPKSNGEMYDLAAAINAPESYLGAANGNGAAAAASAPEPKTTPRPSNAPPAPHAANFTAADLHEALEVVRQLDPPGVGCRDLRECLLRQLRYHQQQLALHKNGDRAGESNGTAQVLQDAIAIVDQHLARRAEQAAQGNRQGHRPPAEAVQQALDYIRTLDPRPGLRYNKVQPA
jgi:RNA polymerase sigma-54 factor